jgi:Beta-lactamase/Starch binding domain
MQKITIILLFLAVCFSTFAKTVTFQVNASKLAKGKFTQIFIRGNTAPLSWEKGIALSDADGDGIFTVNLSFDSDKSLEYKYLCDDSRWEGVKNRSLILTENTTTNDIWNRDVSQKPYFFQKDGKTIDLATRMRSEQVVHGVSQILVRNGKVDTLMTWGYRDMEAKLPVDAQTIFHIGGMGQSFTAFMMLIAAEQKRIYLDEKVNNYLKTMQLDGDYTVRDLMLGKIKFNGETKPDGYAKGEKIPTLQEIFAGKNTNTPKMKQSKVKEEDKVIFNIFAPLVAQQLLEDVYEKPFATILQEEILTPLQLKNTYITAELSPEQSKNASVGYKKNGEAVAGKRLIFPELGFGGVWTTPTDYAAFLGHLIKAYRGEDNKLISKDLAKKAIVAENQYRSLVFPQGDSGNYLGGAATGFRTQCSFNADDDTIMVTFMNSYENWRVMLDLEQSSQALWD